MVSNNRKTVRATLFGLLSSGLTLVSPTAIYSYLIGDFKGQSPVVVVSSRGSERVRFTHGGRIPKHALKVYIFVAYASEDGSWTEAQSEDSLDDVEAEIASIVDANAKSTAWEALSQAGESVTDSVMIGGVEYRRETIYYIAS